MKELQGFMDRYSDVNKPLSIGNSALLTKARIERRRNEINSLLEASEAHILAGLLLLFSFVLFK
jgi:hypothetical protein